MKRMLSGNEAFALATLEAGVSLVSSYPGTPSTEITEFVSKYDEVISEWATNEKTAVEACLGASIAGKRSMSCMKHVGLNLASEPLMTSSYTGVNGGLVLIVADDPNMYSSQNEQDSRNFARFAKVPMLEPADSMEAKEFTKLAFDISEEFSTPVLVRSVTRVSHSMSIVETYEKSEKKSKEFEKDFTKWVMIPANARNRHFFVEDRLNAIREYSKKHIKYDKGTSNIGIVCSGLVYQYVKEALPNANVMKLAFSYPIASDEVKSFAKGVEKLYVIEELDPFLERELKADGVQVENLNRSLCGELSVDKVKELFAMKVASVPVALELPNRPPNLCPGCSHRGIFYAMNKLKLFVFGDIGCYTLGCLPPLSSVHTTVCMGSGVSMAHGADRVTNGEIAKKSVAVLGDSTFLHTGLSGLINSVYNKGVSTVVILDNRITGMTGHQPNAASGFTIKGEVANAINFVDLCKAVGVKHISVVDPFDVDSCIDVLKRETQRNEVSVIITNKPCIFADKSVIKPSLHIDDSKCSGCKVCTKLGCPAILWDSEKRHAKIDEVMCNGCDLCTKVCRFDAIIK